ncbi:hypothetical protein H8959_002153 [Pygathrix nigripes]
METAGPEEEPAGATESLQNQDLFNRASPLEQAQDSPIDFHLQSWMNDKEPKIVVLDAGKHFEDKTQNSDLSHTSLLENEKLMLPTSLEDSSDDDIDDEMFYDDHLEAYFEQLAIPGMIYEDLEGPEPAEKGFKLPTNDLSQTSIIKYEFFLYGPWSHVNGQVAWEAGSGGLGTDSVMLLNLCCWLRRCVQIVKVP